MYIMGGIVAVFVLSQSVYFLVRAVKRGRQIGLSTKAMKDAAISSATFSVVPSVPIVLAMVTLAATLGAPFAWMRLSVIGSMTYETMAAGEVAKAASVAAGEMMPMNVFASAMWVMTLGIIIGPVFNIFGLKRYQNRIEKISKRDPKWSKILVDALFMGIIAVLGGQFVAKGIGAFAGFNVQPVAAELAAKANEAAGQQVATAAQFISGFKAQLLTLVSGAVLMLIFGGVIKATKAKWLENFALPLSMIGAIALSVIYHGMF